MPKFYDYEIAGDNGVGDCSEATFVCVGSCRAAGYGVVDYCYAGERVGEVDAPAWEDVSRY
jgi:hypothetical protein